jgi:hypothetical protein
MYQKLIKIILCLISSKYKKLVLTVLQKQQKHFVIDASRKQSMCISENSLSLKNLKSSIKTYGLSVKVAKEV